MRRNSSPAAPTLGFPGEPPPPTPIRPADSRPSAVELVESEEQDPGVGHEEPEED